MRKVKKSSKKKSSKRVGKQSNKRKPRYGTLIKNFSLPWGKKPKLPPGKYVGKDYTGIGTEGGIVYVRSPNGTPTARLHQALEQMLAVNPGDIKITFIPDSNKNIEFDLSRKPPPREEDEMTRFMRSQGRG